MDEFIEEQGEQIADSKLVTFFERHSDKILDYGVNILSALIILVVGMYLIRLLMKVVEKAMSIRDLDVTLKKFGLNLISWVLKIILFMAVIQKLGVESTSFAALIAAAGLGVGFALQGSLGNLAGGVIIMLFRPFNIGDFIEVQGEKGFVEDIQIFSTIIRTFQNKTIYVPNGALSNGNIINISQKGTIRLDIEIGVDYSSDIKHTRKVLLEAVEPIKDISKLPAPSVSLTALADSSINFTLFLWVTPENYYSIRAESLERCKEALDAAGIEIPFPHQVEIRKNV